MQNVLRPSPLWWTKKWTFQWGPLCSPVTKVNCEFMITPRRARGAAGAVRRGQGRLHGARGAGIPPAAPGKGFHSAPALCTAHTCSCPVKSTARWPLFWWHRVATSARSPGSPRLAQERFGAYRAEQGDAQTASPDKCLHVPPRYFALGGSATHRVQLP